MYDGLVLIGPRLAFAKHINKGNVNDVLKWNYPIAKTKTKIEMRSTDKNLLNERSHLNRHIHRFDRVESNQRK